MDEAYNILRAHYPNRENGFYRDWIDRTIIASTEIRIPRPKTIIENLKPCLTTPRGGCMKDNLGGEVNLWDTVIGEIIRWEKDKFPDTVPKPMGVTEQKIYKIPPEFEREDIKLDLNKGVCCGLMDRDYKWLKSKQLASFFAKEMSIKYKMGKGVNANGTPRISWKAFEQLWGFPYGKLRECYNDYRKTNQLPIGIEDIEKIFK